MYIVWEVISPKVSVSTEPGSIHSSKKEYDHSTHYIPQTKHIFPSNQTKKNGSFYSSNQTKNKIISTQ